METRDMVTPSAPAADLSMLVVPLLKGVIYQESDASSWNALLGLQARVRDYVSVLGLDLVLDEAEGYAFLRSRGEGGEGGSEGAENAHGDDSIDDDGTTRRLPRLVARRPLSFPVSLLLALLRKKLAEFDASGSDTRLILSRDDVVELIRVFLPAGSNEARLIDQVDTHLNRVVELGFVRRLKSQTSRPQQMFEVRRILKAFVDAQWLADFDQRLNAYRAQLTSPMENEPAQRAGEGRPPRQTGRKPDE